MMKSIIYTILLFFVMTNLDAQPIKLWDLDGLSDSTVLLYQQIDNTKASSGSATIISFRQKFYLLTASHVAKDLKNDAKVIIRLDGDKPKIINLIENSNNKSIIWTHHPIADLAILELNIIDKEFLQKATKWAFPSEQIYNQKDLPSRDADLTFLGYPRIDLQMEHFSALTFSAYLASGLLTQNRYDTQTKCNFYFLNVPSMQGCSGSGVYFSVKKAMFFGGDATLLIGIVHGTAGDDTGGKLATITPSYYIWDILK